ncbi:MAG: 4'-phosphopantetheinyl transferase superfamily protein [Anaerolineae bacterium]|nr:4'-phosphopantetheinyl transferase superfamily protein [Anaerolineae bacterium]
MLSKGLVCQHPDTPMCLSTNEVHVWMADLNPHNDIVARLEDTLSPDEVARADAYCFPYLRRRYVVARGVLRDVLSRHSGKNPADHRFEYNHAGKPMLADSELDFNLSHTDGMAVYAITSGRTVGIDIEDTTRKLTDLMQVAEYTFSQAEFDTLCALPASQRTQAFFNCWTRKEAYVKALGMGLGYPLKQFDVSIRPGEKPELKRVLHRPKEVERWSFEAFTLPPSYTVALVAEGKGWTTQKWYWTPQSSALPEQTERRSIS